MDITIDIETIPSQLLAVRDYIASTVKPPATMKKAETIAKWEAEEKESAIAEAMDKCALDGAANHIVCISFAFGNNPAQTLIAETPEGERGVLTEFFAQMDAVREFQDNVFIGHNLIGFDLKIIKQRAMILGIKPPSNIPFNAKPWDSSPFDTMLQWDARNFVKLDKIAKAFGLQGKNGEGCKVYEWWQAGKFDKIADYCASDVELTYQVYKRMTWQTS